MIAFILIDLFSAFVISFPALDKEKICFSENSTSLGEHAVLYISLQWTGQENDFVKIQWTPLNLNGRLHQYQLLFAVVTSIYLSVVRVALKVSHQTPALSDRHHCSN